MAKDKLIRVEIFRDLNLYEELAWMVVPHYQNEAGRVMSVPDDKGWRTFREALSDAERLASANPPLIAEELPRIRAGAEIEGKALAELLKGGAAMVEDEEGNMLFPVKAVRFDPQTQSLTAERCDEQAITGGPMKASRAVLLRKAADSPEILPFVAK